MDQQDIEMIVTTFDTIDKIVTETGLKQRFLEHMKKVFTKLIPACISKGAK